MWVTVPPSPFVPEPLTLLPLLIFAFLLFWWMLLHPFQLYSMYISSIILNKKFWPLLWCRKGKWNEYLNAVETRPQKCMPKFLCIPISLSNLSEYLTILTFLTILTIPTIWLSDYLTVQPFQHPVWTARKKVSAARPESGGIGQDIDL